MKCILPRNNKAPKLGALLQILETDSNLVDLRLSRLYEHEAAQVATIDEANDAVDLREEGVVFAATNVLARLQTRAALAHDNRATRHQLSAESLYSKPLRI